MQAANLHDWKRATEHATRFFKYLDLIFWDVRKAYYVYDMASFLRTHSYARGVPVQMPSAMFD